MTTETYDNKPKFDPNKPFTPVEGKPAFDPNKPFQIAGEQVKKKESGFPKIGEIFGISSKTSSTDGQTVLNGDVKSIPGTEKVETKEQIDEKEDPIKSIMAPYRENLGEKYTNYLKIARPQTRSESTGQISIPKIIKDKNDREQLKKVQMDSNAIVSLKTIQNQVEKEAFPDALEASKKLVNYARGKGISVDTDDALLLPDADKILEQLPQNNETIKAAINQIGDYHKIINDFQNVGNGEHAIENAAIDDMRRQSPIFDQQVSKVLQGDQYGGKQYWANLPEAQRGRIVYDYMNNPNVPLALQFDPELLSQYENIKQNFFKIYPDFGKTLVANKLSQERENRGQNNPVLNVVGKKSMDKIADDILTDQEKELYYQSGGIRENIREHIDTPGFVENLGTSTLEALEGIEKTRKELYSASSGSDLLKEQLGEQANAVNVAPKGNLNKFGNITGKFAGMVLPIGYGGRLLQNIRLARTPEIANAMMTGLTFLGQEKAHAREIMPNDEVGQNLYAWGATSAYMLGSNIFKDFKALDGLTKEIRPSIASIVKNYNAGQISVAAAKDAATNAFKSAANKALELGKETISQNTKNAIEMTAIQYGKNMMEKILAPGSSTDGEKDQLVADTFVQTWLGTTPMGMAAAYSNVKQKPVVKDGIYDMANHPDRYREAINLQSIEEPSSENIQNKLKNLDFLVKTKEELDKIPGLKEGQKKSYLLQALNEKMMTDTMPKEPTLEKKVKEKIKQSEINKEQILAGKDVDDLPHEQKEELPDDKLEKELLKVAPEGYKEHYKALKTEGKETGWLGYMTDKAAENPDKFIKEFGDDLFDRMIEKVGTKKLENSLKYLNANIPEDANIPLLEQIIEQRHDKHDKEAIEGTKKPRVRNTADEMESAQPKENETAPDNQGMEGSIEVNEPTQTGETAEIPPSTPKGGEAATEKPQAETITIKSEDNAIQESSPRIILQHSQEGAREQGSERGGMESSLEGEEPPGTQEPIQEGQTSSEEKRTGIKNAVSEGSRAIFDLPKVEVPKYGSDSIVIQQGKELVDKGTIKPEEIIHRITTTDNHNMSRDESKAMQYYMHQLGAAEDVVRKQIALDLEPTEKAKLTGQLQQLVDLHDAATEANIKAGKDWSDVGNIRQILVDQGFNPSREKAVIKDAYGGEIPKDVQLRIDTALKERDAAIEQRNKIEEQLREKEAALKVAEMQKGVKRSTIPKKDYTAKRQSLAEELKKAKEEHEQWLKDQGIQKSGVGFTLTGKMIKIIGEYAFTYAEQGVEKASDIINKVFEEVKAVLPGSTRNDIRDAIALYESEKLNTKAQGKEKKLDEGDVKESTPKLKLKFQNHTEWVKANQRVSNADFKIREEKRKAFESQKNYFQKGLMWAGRLTRLSVLSGYNVLYKLAAAATIGGAAKRIPEQAIGGIYSQIFKGVAKKAPIEGFWNAKSEAKFYKDFFNPNKFVKNSWQILRTGESDLNKRFGGGGYEHVPLLYLPTDLHQIIKDPVKRATFEASVNNAMIWAEKNGLDITDPLVINSIETAAYKRGNYEIFQEQNWLSRKFGEFKSKMEKSGNVGSVGKFIADFMIPVSTVPTNIVRRLVTTSPLGLIRGGGKVVDAYRKGIENLTTEQGDAVMKQLKQGTLGTALWLIGWFGAAQFGGLYSKYNPNKQRKEGDKASDEMEVGGKMLPKPVQHALPLEIIQWAATSRRIYDNYKDRKKESTFQSILNAGLGSIGALAEQIPVVETAAHAFGAVNNPYEGEKLKEDVKRRFEPQILRETGVIGSKKK